MKGVIPTTEGLKVMTGVQRQGSRAPGKLTSQPWPVFYPGEEEDSGWGRLGGDTSETLDLWGSSFLLEASSPPLCEDDGEVSASQGNTCPPPSGSPPRSHPSHQISNEGPVNQHSPLREQGAFPKARQLDPAESGAWAWAES